MSRGNPCRQIDDFRRGLLQVVVSRPDGVHTSSEVELGPTGGALRLDAGRPSGRPGSWRSSSVVGAER